MHVQTPYGASDISFIFGKARDIVGNVLNDLANRIKYRISGPDNMINKLLGMAGWKDNIPRPSTSGTS